MVADKRLPSFFSEVEAWVSAAALGLMVLIPLVEMAMRPIIFHRSPPRLTIGSQNNELE